MGTQVQLSTPATTAQIAEALQVLFNSMPLPRGSDPDKAAIGYVTALKGFTQEAIVAGVSRFLRGECEEVSQKFCPHPPELAAIIRRTVHTVAQKTTYRPVERVPFLERIERKRREYAHRPILFTDVSYDQWRMLSRSGQVPVGGVWVASLGTVYGPEPKVHWEAAE